MRIGLFRRLACLAVALGTAGPALAADLYLAGDIGISWLEGDGTGTNDLVGITNSGSSKDTSPVYGGALGIAFPLDAALPWRLRMPGFGEDGFRFPDWEVRFEVEHLRGRDFDLATRSFNTLEPYRADVESWSVMGTLRMDVPLRTPVYAALGRVPFFDPLTLYFGGGAGLGETDLQASTGLLFGSDSAQDFAWQAIAGFGYDSEPARQVELRLALLRPGQGQDAARRRHTDPPRSLLDRPRGARVHDLALVRLLAAAVPR